VLVDEGEVMVIVMSDKILPLVIFKKTEVVCQEQNAAEILLNFWGRAELSI
jgi:hypothetical protein